MDKGAASGEARAVVNGAGQAVSALRASVPSAGDVFTIAYPFVRGTYTDFEASSEANDTVDRPTWTPGVRFEDVGPEDCGTIADGLGSATFTVIDTHKPGRFPTRVFFTRQFTNPDGKVFGKGRLHIVTLDKFRRLSRGYQHPFGLDEPLVTNRWTAKQAEAEFLAMLADHAQGMSAGTVETHSGSGPTGRQSGRASDAPDSSQAETNHAN